MLTKSDFLLYMDAPRHLWAKIHDKIPVSPISAYDRHLMEQGYAVEAAAKEFLTNIILSKYKHAELLWQPTYKSGQYQCRADAVIHDLDKNSYDLYEIKSSTQAKKEHLPDATFQRIVIGKNIELNSIHLVLLNDKYVRGEAIELEQLFLTPDVTVEVAEMTSEIEVMMRQALAVMKQEKYEDVPNCLNPTTCPCLELCHPQLPTPSIYNIPHLAIKKRRELDDSGLINLSDLPLDYPLTANQQKHVDVMTSRATYLDKPRVSRLLACLTYPLYFLDYETYAQALPLYPGHKPYQNMVFQYSLHVLMAPGEEYLHHEHLATDPGDPALGTVEQMRRVIGDTGSVIVWNKGFEGGRNSEMAAMFPEFSEFLTSVNSRMFDLMEIVSKGYYLRPEFGGRHSIKNVLPVMAPELSYKKLAINKGDQAMIAWWEMVNSEEVAKEQTAAALLKYCQLDTFAMVRIWEELARLVE